ncbi:hypothetical protein AAAW51_003335 [Cronobacter sakazakii]
MSEISKERVEALASNILECHDVKPSEVKALAALALMALRERAEPVAYISKADLDAGYPHILARKEYSKACPMAVYNAPPAQVVPDCLQRLLKHAEGLTFGSDWNNGTAAKYHRDALIQAVKDCRAAMLAAPGKEG